MLTCLIEKSVCIDAYMPHREKCVWVGERNRDRTSGPHYFLKYQIQKHPAIDAYMLHREKCVWVGERNRDRTSGASSL